MDLPARSTPSNTTKVPRWAGFEAATADMVRKRLKIVLAVRFPRLRLRGVEDYVKTSGAVPLPSLSDRNIQTGLAGRLLVCDGPLAFAGLTCQKKLKRARSLTSSHGGNRSASPVAAVVQKTSPDPRKYEYW